MMTKTVIFLGGLALLTAACGGKEPETAAGKAGPVAAPTQAMTAEAANKFNAALDAFTAHDRARDWAPGVCAEVAGLFQAAAAEQPGGKLASAIYDAGLAYQRCGDDKEAKARFQQALGMDPNDTYSRGRLALYQFQTDGNEDSAIGTFQQLVLDAKFQNVPALTTLAMLQMQRDSAQAGDHCKDDLDCAKQNLQRALAIDDSYMPAFNELALLYFQVAKKRAGTIKAKGGHSVATNSAMAKRADGQQLELAALVCSQAIRKNPNYSPIHNTAGLIQNELGQVNGAVGEFALAAKLDPRFFEAQMNYAAVNLSFRGFEQAQGAYQKALAMRPNDYDAHLGLALALRGLITDVNYDTQVAAVQAELDTCKKLDAARPDAYYNEGILTQEFKAKAGGDKNVSIKALTDAKGIFQVFIDRAGDKTEYAGAVKRAKERMQDCDDIKAFLLLGSASPTPPPAPPAAGAAPAADAPAGAAPPGAVPPGAPPAAAPPAAEPAAPPAAPAPAAPPAQ
jgi:tetratricopeptide (TPR) repeat protein